MGLDDATGKLERTLDSAVERIEAMRDKMIPRVVNRPLDSEKMSRQEMLQDYGMARNDPVLLTQRMQEFQTQHGKVKGLEVWMDWIEDSERG